MSVLAEGVHTQAQLEEAGLEIHYLRAFNRPVIDQPRDDRAVTPII